MNFFSSSKLFLVLWQYRTEQDPIKKEERKAKLMRETIPFYLTKFERVVANNNGLSVGTDVSTYQYTLFSKSFKFIQITYCNLFSKICA